MEKTFVMLKPDAVRRGLVGEIIGRFERKGLRIVEMRHLTPSRALAEEHYAVHRGKPFYDAVVDFITSGPVVAMVLEGPENSVAMVRQMMGATAPWDAAPGSIRGDFASTTQQNLVHGSDSVETAHSEIALWFS
ncbi:MAG TPA: nucleoside-diphosphate kinase [Armatimonadota bacterium]